MARIFLIERDKFFSSSLEAKFSFGGFEVKIPYDLNNDWFLIQEVKSYKPHFIVLEPDLPLSYGMEIMSNIKKENDLWHTPIFLFSNITQDYVDKFLSQSENFYFSKKDLNVDDFVDSVSRIAKNKYKINL